MIFRWRISRGKGWKMPSAIMDSGEIIENNPRQTLRTMIFQAIRSRSRIIRRLAQIGRKTDKWVPHELSNMQESR